MHSIGKQPMSHYEFQKSIALAWLDPTTYWPNRMKNCNKSIASTTSNSHRTTTISRKRKSTSSISSQSNQNPSINQDNIKKRAPPVNDKTLCPREGVLWCCLDMTIPHLPSASNCKEPKCALHFQACKKKHRYCMLRCTACGIHLCIACYEKFHWIEEIGDLKNTFQQESWGANDITEMITMANHQTAL